MKDLWRVHRSREVTHYLTRLRDQGRGIRQVIALLIEYGVPATAELDDTETPPTYTWEAAGHVISCIVAQEDRAIYVSAVEPLEEPDEKTEE